MSGKRNSQSFGSKINYSSWDGKGQLRANGEAVQFEDLRVSANSTNANGSNPPSDALFLGDGNEIPGTAYALSFLSTNQGNLTLPDDTDFDTSADFYFSFWLRPQVGTQNNIELLRKQNVFTLTFTGVDQLTLSVTGASSGQSSIAFNRGSWNYISIMHDDSEDEVYLYMNNTLALIISAASVPDNTNDFVFNRRETLFDIDYVEYWDVVKTPSEINLRYASGAGVQLAGNEVGLEGLWELNDGSGTTVIEKTGLATDGTISGGTEGVQWAWVGGHVGNTSPGSRGVILKYFNPDVLNELYFDVQMPHNWEQGTTIHPHVHWVPNANGTGTQDVKWALEYTWANIGSVFGNTSTISGDTNHLAETLVKNKHYITGLTDIDATGKTFSSMLCCRMYRDSEDVNDDFTDFAGLLEIDFHYKVNSLGSNEEYVKY